MRKELEQRIVSLGLERDVFLPGNVRNISEELVKSSIFVLSSRFEGFGIVLLEAAAAGLPIIAYDCPNGPGEILRGDKGVLVEPNNKEKLKEQILRLISSEKERRYYASKNKEILEPFSEQKILEEWRRVIKVFTKK